MSDPLPALVAAMVGALCGIVAAWFFRRSNKPFARTCVFAPLSATLLGSVTIGIWEAVRAVVEDHYPFLGAISSGIAATVLACVWVAVFAGGPAIPVGWLTQTLLQRRCRDAPATQPLPRPTSDPR